MTVLMLGSMASYSDGRVTCTDQEIVIRHPEVHVQVLAARGLGH